MGSACVASCTTVVVVVGATVVVGPTVVDVDVVVGPVVVVSTMVVTAAVAVFINGFSSILTGLNFLVTVHTMRAPGMTWFRLPLFVWGHYATSLIQVLGTPVLAIAVELGA